MALETTSPEDWWKPERKFHMPAHKWTPDESYQCPSYLVPTRLNIKERKDINFIQSHLTNNISGVSQYLFMAKPAKHSSFLTPQPTWIPALRNLPLQPRDPLHSSPTVEVDKFQPRSWARRSNNQIILIIANVIYNTNTLRRGLEQDIENNQSQFV